MYMESGRFTAAVVGLWARLARPFAWSSAVLVGSFLAAFGLIQLLGGLDEAVPERYHVLLASHLLFGIFVYLSFRIIVDVALWLDILDPARVSVRYRFWRRLFWSFLGPGYWPEYLLVSGLLFDGLGYADIAPLLFGWLICGGLVGAFLLSTYYAATGGFGTGPLLRLARACPGLSGLPRAR